PPRAGQPLERVRADEARRDRRHARRQDVRRRTVGGAARGEERADRDVARLARCAAPALGRVSAGLARCRIPPRLHAPGMEARLNRRVGDDVRVALPSPCGSHSAGTGDCIELAWRGVRMLFIAVLLLVLWFLGLMTTYTLGGLLHILLVVAIVLFLIHVIQGRPIGA